MKAVFLAARSFVSFECLGWFGLWCIVGAAIFAVVGIVDYGSYVPFATRFGLCVTGWNLSLGLLWLGTTTFVPAFAAYVLRRQLAWTRLIVATVAAVCVILTFPFQFGLGQCWPSTDDPKATSLMIYVVPFDLAERETIRGDGLDLRMHDVDDPSLDWNGGRRRGAVDVMIGHSARTGRDHLTPEVVSALKDRSTSVAAMRFPQCVRQSIRSLGTLLLVVRKETSLGNPLAKCS